MAKTVKGSTFFDNFGGYIFTPFTNSPDNKNWLLLKQVVDGKLECSKNKVRITITLKRGNISKLSSSFESINNELVSALKNDAKVQHFYELAKELKPCEIEDEEDDIPMHG